ncbi:hypothetical protein P7K49_035073 [Saguinus oedipus]|uniref:Uncharacterized protein n=1 Tax=Saguinus oedipus TaxID=9490 RepID=A0ABQ9TX24_SAGOE|nr:hypothetical protein P7K49_035073 [Saguinus oedipus]
MESLAAGAQKHEASSPSQMLTEAMGNESEDTGSDPEFHHAKVYIPLGPDPHTYWSSGRGLWDQKCGRGGGRGGGPRIWDLINLHHVG